MNDFFYAHNPSEIPDGESWCILYIESYRDSHNEPTTAWKIVAHKDKKSFEKDVIDRETSNWKQDYVAVKLTKCVVKKTIKVEIA